MKFLKIGFLGGGQLARMMLPTCARLGLESYVLDGANCVAGGGSDHHIVGDFRNYDDVMNFAKDLDVLTVDLEDVNVEALEALEKKGLAVTPSSGTLKTIQDKGIQKLFFEKNNLPTAAFKLIDSPHENQIESGVLKLRRGGYDGKGVHLFNKGDKLPNGFDGPLLWEEKVGIKNEISVLVARSRNGDVCVYDPVSMVFDPELNLIAYTLCPSLLSKELTHQAKELALKVANSLDSYGVLAVEMFETDEGKLLINELAPRPHNSGHHTIESTLTDQFAQHVRAVCGLPLGSPLRHSHALTYNLVMSKNTLTGPVVIEGLDKLLSLEGVFFHWYGKNEARAGRKMGHVTILSQHSERLLPLYQKVRTCLKIKTAPLLA